ncbi:MAG: methionyl-tRNA formyltransferase [Bacteroidetes bacterium]|nr:methionyl-tRNA formyltransferase [Bacteroidota bacterium]MDA0907149.1 methionyl-tRNA formyltransferase [Bacteroidota bacterium]
MTTEHPSTTALRVIFMGSPEFAVPSLEALVREGFDVCLVCTPPDKRRSRGGDPEPTAVKKKAIELGLPTLDVEDVKDPAFCETLTSLNADVSVVVAFRLLPKAILDATRLGAVNIHASLLPAYRGAAPIHHAVLNGEKQTGCTLFVLNQAMDAGQILAQQTSPIHPNDTTGDVYERLQTVGAKLLIETLPAWNREEIHPITQDERLATPAPKVFSADGWLRLHETAAQVHNQARAMTPTPGAWIKLEGEKVKILRTRLLELRELQSFTHEVKGDVHGAEIGMQARDEHRAESGVTAGVQSGSFYIWDKRLFLGCAEQSVVEIVTLQQPGKTAISGYEFSLGKDLAALHAEGAEA